SSYSWRPRSRRRAVARGCQLRQIALDELAVLGLIEVLLHELRRGGEREIDRFLPQRVDGRVTLALDLLPRALHDLLGLRPRLLLDRLPHVLARRPALGDQLRRLAAGIRELGTMLVQQLGRLG